MNTKQWLLRYRTDLAALGVIAMLLLASALAIQGKSVAAGVIGMAGVLYLANYGKIRGPENPKTYFTLFIWGDVDSSLEGPFATAADRDAKSIEIRRREGPDEGASTSSISTNTEDRKSDPITVVSWMMSRRSMPRKRKRRHHSVIS